MTTKQGWLRKNHKSGNWASRNERRWFVSEGFNVLYYEDNSKSTIKGHFDLRNVVSIRDSTDPTAPDAVDIHIAESTARKVTKKLMISFVMYKNERPAWLRLWCSAIDPKYIDVKLKGSADVKLAATLNVEYANQVAPSAKRSLLSKGFSKAKILSPRDSSQAQLQLDTQREPETPEAPPKTAAPPPLELTAFAAAAVPGAARGVAVFPAAGVGAADALAFLPMPREAAVLTLSFSMARAEEGTSEELDSSLALSALAAADD